MTTQDEECIKLPATLDLFTAVSLRETLRDAIVGPTKLVVDAADVASVTTPCIQILISAARTAAAGGCTLSIANSSAAMTAAITELGLKAEFDLWSTTS